MNSLLEVKKLSFSWGESRVLKELDLSIYQNEIVSILGVNGAGKSAVLKCLNKVLVPDSGKIEILSQDLSTMRINEVSKLISFVPQSLRSNFPMDVFDVVLLGRRPYLNWSVGRKDRDKVSQTLRMLNLQGFAFRRFDQLSGGERQRVIIAKAVAQDTNLLLLDEPTSDLDLKNQIGIMKRIKHLVSDKESKKSALIAIHDINIAARFSDRILLLDEGKIIAHGTPEKVLNKDNIARVFGVTSNILPATENDPLRIILKDEIECETLVIEDENLEKKNEG